MALTDGKLVTSEGCATISDFNGNLLFYTDGVTIWDRRHNVMPNGQGLLGHSSSTASALIIPKPGSKSKYYVFTIDQPSYFLKDRNEISGVNYSEIDLALNNGYGDVINEGRNVHLITYNTNDEIESKYKSTEKITAVTHSDGASIWVITYFMNRFYSFLVNNNGVSNNPVVSVVPQLIRPVLNSDGANISAIGYLKVSPNGKKIAIAHSSTILGSPRSGRKKSGKVFLYDFNNSNGKVSNELTILSNGYPYGVEFSPNSKLLYITNSVFDEDDSFVRGELYQFNVEENNIAATKQTIRSSQNVAGALQLAIDGKIYRAGYKFLSTGTNISVINRPNNLGDSCEYNENTISLGGKAAKLGLPPFVQSIFHYSFDFEHTCLGDQTKFYITSEEPYDFVTWSFGDGQVSNEDEPYHTYQSDGVYTVSLTFSLNGISSEPIFKQVIVSKPPDIINTIYELIQCDSFDNNPNDGISVFNLESANAPVSLNSNEAIQIYYYHNEADAINDVNNLMALPNIYKNQYENEILYAKVLKLNTLCYNIARVRLKTSQPVNIDARVLVACDYENNSFGIFDLVQVENSIIADFNLTSNHYITFHESEIDAAIGVNNLPKSFRSNNKYIFIRITSDNACYGLGILQLKVNRFPELENQTLNVCQLDFPVKIETGINTNELSEYSYYWDTGENTSEIIVNTEGVYEVTVYDETKSCEKTVSITVNKNKTPIIEKIITESQKAQIILNSFNNDFLFALDDVYGTYQESNIFLNITPGLHYVFVKDIYGCETTSKSFYIFGFPKYFTPNNDGNNDFWNVYGLNSDQFLNEPIFIKIFNRYGKFLRMFNPLKSNGWDGVFNGKLLAPDDYWYYLILPNGETYKGHFTLKM